MIQDFLRIFTTYGVPVIAIGMGLIAIWILARKHRESGPA